MTKTEMQQVLDALLRFQTKRQDFNTFEDVIAIMQAAVDAPEVEPVAYADPSDLAKDGNWDTFIAKHASQWHNGLRFKTPLYAAPQERKPLTDNAN